MHWFFFFFLKIGSPEEIACQPYAQNRPCPCVDQTSPFLAGFSWFLPAKCCGLHGFASLFPVFSLTHMASALSQRSLLSSRCVRNTVPLMQRSSTCQACGTDLHKPQRLTALFIIQDVTLPRAYTLIKQVYNSVTDQRSQRNSFKNNTLAYK